MAATSQNVLESDRVSLTVQTYQKDWKRQLCLSLSGLEDLRWEEICGESVFKRERILLGKWKRVYYKGDRNYEATRFALQPQTILSFLILKLTLYSF